MLNLRFAHRVGFRLSGVIIFWLFLSVAARGGIVNLVSQARFVSVHFTDSTPEQFQQAPDFGPFTAQVGFLRGTNAIADQRSTLSLTPDGAVFNAISNVRGSSPAAIFGSSFHVGFEVTQPVDYTLTYGFGASGTGKDITPSALFSGPFGTRDIHLGVNESGVLEPGSYQLQIDAADGLNISYFVTLAAVPLPSALSATLAMLPVVILVVRWRGRKARTREGCALGKG